jgi:hypothetical protein
VGHALLLVLLANADMYGLIAACALGGALAWDRLQQPCTEVSPARRRADATAAVIIFLAGAVTALVQMWPAPDAEHFIKWETGFNPSRLGHALSAVWDGCVPVPNFAAESFWNTNLLFTAVPGCIAAAVLSLGILGLFAIRFFPDRVVLCAWAVSTAAVVGFNYFVFIGFARHHGIVFLLLLACWWLREGRAARKPAPAPARPGRARAAGRAAGGALLFILAAQAACGLHAWIQDWMRPFSAAARTADFLRGHGLADPDVPIVGTRDYAASSVAGFLDRPVHYPEIGRAATYIKWHRERRMRLKLSELAVTLRGMAERHGGRCVLLLNAEITRTKGKQKVPTRRMELGGGWVLVHIAAFEDSLVTDEKFYVYEVKGPHR